MNRLACLMLAALPCLPLGCTHYTHLGLSLDRHTFHSTQNRPLTVELVDRSNGESLWMLDIPVNKMAVVQINHVHSFMDYDYGKAPPVAVSWDIFERDQSFGQLANRMPLPGNPVMLKLKVRDDPLALFHKGPIDDVYRNEGEIGATVAPERKPASVPIDRGQPAKPTSTTPGQPNKPTEAPVNPDAPDLQPDLPKEPNKPVIPIDREPPKPGGN